MAFQGFLKQSTAVDVLIGPFLDQDDGKTAEASLTISQADVKLSKNGQTLAQKNDVTACASDGSDGYYNCELDATDVNTVGQLTIIIHESGALPVRLDYHIVEEAVYDAMYGATAAGPLQSTTAARKLDVTSSGAAGVDWGNVENQGTTVDLSATDIQLCDTITTYTGNTVQTGDSFARLGAPAGASVSTDVADVPTVSEFNARTLVAASYFDPAADTVALVTNLTNLPSIPANWLTAAGIASGAFDVAVWRVDATNEQAQGTFGQAIGDPVADATTIYQAVATDASGDNVSIDVVAVKAETALIVVDTDDIGVAGAGLSAIPWNAAWDAEVESEVNDALDTAISELGVAAPAATPTIRTGLMLLYMALRNKSVVQTSGTDALEIYDNAGTIIAKKLLTDDGTDYTEAEMA